MQTEGSIVQVKIDKFGRVVLPRLIRRQVQVGAGSVLEIEVVGRGEIVLSPVRDEQPLLEKDGLLVYGGRPTADLEEAGSASGKRGFSSGNRC